MRQIRRPRLRVQFTFANVTAALALFIALGGTSYAVSKLPKNSVTTVQVRDGSLKRADLAPDAIQPGATGARGPRGAIGPDGATGPAGRDGRDGAVGKEAWQTLITAAPNWSPYGLGHPAPTFRKDQVGVVRLHGIVTKSSGTGARGDLIAQLPVGYRPTQEEAFAVATGTPGPSSTASRRRLRAASSATTSAGPRRSPTWPP